MIRPDEYPMSLWAFTSALCVLAMLGLLIWAENRRQAARARAAYEAACDQHAREHAARRAAEVAHLEALYSRQPYDQEQP